MEHSLTASIHKPQILHLLLHAFDQFKGTLPIEKRLKATEGMGLLEGGAELDSLEILNFLTIVEKIREKFGIKLVIFDLNAMKQSSNPFATIDTLADSILLIFQRMKF